MEVDLEDRASSVEDLAEAMEVPSDEVATEEALPSVDGAIEVEVDPAKKRAADRRVRVEWRCINPHCPDPAAREGAVDSGGARLVTAGHFEREYFGLKPDDGQGSGPEKKSKICLSCAEESGASLSAISDNLRAGRPAFQDIGSFMAAMDMVTLDDSDEDGDDGAQTDSSDESVVELEVTGERGDSAKSKFEALMAEMLEDKFEMGKQVDEAVGDVKERCDLLGDKMQEVEEMFDEVEKNTDDLRHNLYKHFRPKISELKPVDLNALEREQQLRPRVQRQQQQQQRDQYKLVRPPPLSPVAVVAGAQPTPMNVNNLAQLPPNGDLQRPPLKVGDKAFAMRGNILQIWKLGNVVDVFQGASPTYKLKFDLTDSKGKLIRTQSKVLQPKHLAYSDPAPVKLPVGTRVVAVYRDPSDQATLTHDSYYSGVVAEPPKNMNKFRYLVFFDDGYASYIAHDEVRVVAHQSKDVWDDIHQNSREFVKKYLLQYPERPMVKMTVGQIVRTEWEGQWLITRVQEIDASLVRLRFEVDGRVENIYRGSTRLGPLYMELQQQKRRKEAQALGGANVVRRHQFNRRDGPYVEYTRQQDNVEAEDPGTPGMPAKSEAKRSVARKSTSSSGRRSGDQLVGPGYLTINNERVSTQIEERWDTKGEVSKAAMRRVQGYPYVPHECGQACLEDPKYTYHEKTLRGNSPLLVPIILGWQRILAKHKMQGRRTVFYIAPCGRRLRNLDEIHQYLRLTESSLEIDFFNFEWYVHIRNEFEPGRVISDIQDISYGKEHVPISCVNSLDKDFPVYVEYSTKRIPKTDVYINTDTEFLACCDCTDDCQNKEKCACWQLTIQSTAASDHGKVDPNVGYKHRRLLEPVQTGIFECNSRCSCKKTCLNRVAQHPLRQRLQVFKTKRRGWGIRTLVDIPAGAFICVYVGNLYSNAEANQVGKDFGDEYFAELDMIETIERQKDGYESDVDEEDEAMSAGSLSPFRDDDDGEGAKDDNDEECLPSTEDEDDDDDEDNDKSTDFTFQSNAKATGDLDSGRPTRRARKKPERLGHEEQGDGQRTPMQQSPKKKAPKAKAAKDAAPKEKLTSTRKFFGRDEDVYIMDAKTRGNIGRYLNHSCSPNVFVQNCFVDTHDLRFPWVAFFALEYIRAGGELCWDYCYVVGQVDGKEILCGCGSNQCRGRLL